MNEENKEIENKEIASLFSAVSVVSIVYGIILVIISLLIFHNTKETYTTVTMLLGVYLMVRGLIDFFAVFNSRNPQRGRTFFVSLVSFFAGLFVLVTPVLATGIWVTIVVYVIGLTLLLNGIVFFKVSVPMAITNILIGILMFFFTKEFAIGFALFIAISFLMAGIAVILLGAATKNVVREIEG